MSQSSREHEQMVSIWKLPDCPEGARITLLYRKITDVEQRQAFLRCLPSIEQAVFRAVEALPANRVPIVHLRNKLPFEELRLRQALGVLGSAGLLVLDGASVGLPDELRSAHPDPRSRVEDIGRSAVAQSGAADMIPASVSLANAAWLDELRRVLGGGGLARSKVGISPKASYFLKHFARDLGLLDNRGHSTSATVVWLSLSRNLQQMALFEFWLSDRRRGEVQRSKITNLPRARQRLCAALRRLDVGGWSKPPLAPSPGAARRRVAGRASSSGTLAHDTSHFDDLREMGIVDLGYDRGARLIGIRLTAVGGMVLRANRTSEG